ncbi:probable plastid-lipid-associated protein 10, chloroplastic isoform X3 [Actinidia eriantha]|uniref:probable plastid-lipid-associated protein 10, chloroplastic isoform X3 n=1 Tax=Actinidia eriantha TaxID=165200 RepID=UPI0025839BB1|nr:probable plastid-lipid-associated protein 10, chloroplastic isoform X3 [Actinidia eriantha]
MDLLAFPTLLSFPAGNRDFQETNIKPSAARARKRFPCLANTHPIQIEYNELDLENKKQQLLSAIQDTQRGLMTSAHQRSFIEEALVSLETYHAAAPIDLGKLDGTWRLQYTSAPDVLILLESAATFPIFQVGQIFQKFECKNESDGGIVRNVVRWSIPNLLEIAVQNINISEELQALIAPAILPRLFFSLQILQFIRSFKAQVPVRNAGRQVVGGLYYLSYLDGSMLLGRADGGGVFVFTRAQPLV